MTKETKKEVNEAVEEVVQEPVQQDQPQIDLNDIAGLLGLVELSVKRGTYDPKELVSVGTLYTKVDAFIQHQVELQKAANQAGDTNGGT